jgi:hypothetical protein
MDANDPRSIPELFSTVTGDLANLVRKESELIRAEVSEKISQAGKAAAAPCSPPSCSASASSWTRCGRR